MQYEVEAKLTLNKKKEDKFLAALSEAGFSQEEKKSGRDLYFLDCGGHLSSANGALRLRKRGSKLELTLKAPAKADGTRRARSEIEIPIRAESEDDALRFLVGLGYLPYIVVEKDRVEHLGKIAGKRASIAFDTLKPHGDVFLEVELLTTKPEEVSSLEKKLQEWIQENERFVQEEKRNYRDIVADSIAEHFRIPNVVEWIAVPNSAVVSSTVLDTILAQLSKRCEILSVSEIPGRWRKLQERAGVCIIDLGIKRSSLPDESTVVKTTSEPAPLSLEKNCLPSLEAVLFLILERRTKKLQKT